MMVVIAPHVILPILFYVAFPTIKSTSSDSLLSPCTSNIVIVGGMSFHGAMIANYLHDKYCSVTVIEDSINIEPVPIKWYRWTYLPVRKEFVDFTHDINKLKNVLNTSKADSVLYIPTGIIDIHDPARVNQVGTSTMAHFQKFLSITSEVPSVKQIILFSTVDDELGSNFKAIHKTWMSSLEQMLIYFHHQIKDGENNIALIKVNGVFGPSKGTTESTDKCWYIDSVADLVYDVTHTLMSDFTMIDLTAKCEHDITHGIAVTERWIKDYEIYSKKQTRNVVSGAVIVYDSKAKWRAGSARSNDHNYLKPFVLSAMKLQKVEILIIHNTLTDTQKYEKACPSCLFVKYSPVNKRIAHDQRFYMIYDYLLKNPDISNFVTADLKDVVFYSDPFKIMNEIGDYFYVSYDVPIQQYLRNMGWIKHMLKKCYPLIKLEDEVYDLYGGFNSGVMGGSRHVMLTLLSRIILYLDIASINGVCDMVTANVVYHLQDYERIYAGYPFTGSFMIRVSGPQGCAIKHKPYA